MKILVVYGGEGLSKEAEISERSGKTVLEVARSAGFEMEGFKLTAGNLDELKNVLKNFDVVFPALHGVFGEDGQIQEIFEKVGIKYVGCESEASRLCFDKDVYKKKLRESGILTPDWWILRSGSEIEKLKAPVVVKPISGGASIDMVVARKPDELDLERVKQLLDTYSELMIEEYIDGQEIAVGVLGDEALPAVEIIPSEGKWFDLESKYSDKTQENIPPKHISEEIQKQAQELALKIHRLMGCKDISRTDMIVRDRPLSSTRDRQIYVLETNTMPGMTPQSLYLKEARTAGYEMPELVKKLVS